jgi:hypothetical protein
MDVGGELTAKAIPEKADPTASIDVADKEDSEGQICSGGYAQSDVQDVLHCRSVTNHRANFKQATLILGGRPRRLSPSNRSKLEPCATGSRESL